MSYFTKPMAKRVLSDIQDFEKKLCDLFKENGINLRDNLGRRNALVSQVQERAVARALRTKYAEVIEDGAPGKPDVEIVDIDKELECKLTSGSRSNGSVAYSLQTDWATLCNKETLDYLYIIANPDFDSFCVLFFNGLTSDDFFPPASGSRGKSRMKKKNAMKKCTVLFGDVVNLNIAFNDKYEDKIANLLIDCDTESLRLFSEYADSANKINKNFDDFKKKVLQVNEKYNKKIEMYETRIEKWNKKC